MAAKQEGSSLSQTPEDSTPKKRVNSLQGLTTGGRWSPFPFEIRTWGDAPWCERTPEEKAEMLEAHRYLLNPKDSKR